MKNLIVLVGVIFSSISLIAQESTYPLFESCSENANELEQKQCFESTFKTYLFNLLENSKDQTEGQPSQVGLIFDVDKEGQFNLIFVNAENESIKSIFKKAFDQLPQVKPSKIYGKPTFMQFNMDLVYPPKQQNTPIDSLDKNTNKEKSNLTESLIKAKQEFDEIENETKTYDGELFSSYAYIPLSHEIYNRFDREINLIGTNSHTAQKPFTYKDVKPYYDFKAVNDSLSFNKTSWFGRKLFDEHLATVSGKNYWLTLDFGVDVQVGRDTDADLNTYNNTRVAFVQGGVGEKLTYYGAIFESQGRFADYFNRLARSRAPIDGNPAIIPGRGVAKDFNSDAFDYPVTVGYINYRINDNFNAQIGNYKNFIGDGYRSLFLSDNASPYPYVKVDAKFWKIKYTNIWMQARNTNLLTDREAFQTKFMAIHHLSYNVTKKLNIGLFEAAIWDNEEERGFDISYLNPLLFYQMVEFSTGTEGGKVMVGANYKYKWTDNIHSYGQLLIDELSLDDISSGDKSFRNKFGLQLGIKYFDAFKVKDFDLQLEYNQVRPFTFSHNKISTNYTHNGQSLAHLWGANFREIIAIARYRKNRWFGHTKLIFGERGFEPEADLDPFYGSDLFGTEDNLFSETGNTIGQGNRVNSYYAELEAGYLINPATNFKVYLNVIGRNFDATTQNERTFDNNTVWVNFGLRTDLFNWYFDY
ncbi:gliding motility protein RemB [Flavobacteriaceae bacterium 14752]|uniref:gliding motility protein RemB n=1 Tax=Mesohalobacter salilacus TaxID=2491711 RepID=UPI000F6375D1|nr:gliding motility protein RemB [Flavobacteriaceae bacterium 14752]